MTLLPIHRLRDLGVHVYRILFGFGKGIFSMFIVQGPVCMYVCTRSARTQKYVTVV